MRSPVALKASVGHATILAESHCLIVCQQRSVENDFCFLDIGPIRGRKVFGNASSANKTAASVSPVVSSLLS